MSARRQAAGARPPRRGLPPSQQGFSLLEVLVAIVLLGFSYAGILSALSQGLKLARSAADQENAAILAHSLLEETRALPKTDIVDPVDRGEVFGGTRYAYKVEIFDVPYLGNPPPDKVAPPFELKQIVVNVHWGPEDRQRHYRLATYQTMLAPLGEAGKDAPTAATAGEPAKAAQGTANTAQTPTTPGIADAAKKP